jgi:hypothetical protein
MWSLNLLKFEAIVMSFFLGGGSIAIITFLYLFLVNLVIIIFAVLGIELEPYPQSLLIVLKGLVTLQG